MSKYLLLVLVFIYLFSIFFAAERCTEGGLIRCSRNILQICDGAFWQDFENCQYGCDPNLLACYQCQKGTSFCSGNVLVSCPDGYYSNYNCEREGKVCDSNKKQCLTNIVCSNGDRVCNGNILLECKANKWIELFDCSRSPFIECYQQTPSFAFCKECSAVGEKACTSLKSYRRCLENFSWSKEEFCPTNSICSLFTGNCVFSTSTKQTVLETSRQNCDAFPSYYFTTLVTDTLDRTLENRMASTQSDIYSSKLEDNDVPTILSPLRGTNYLYPSLLYRISNQQFRGFENRVISIFSQQNYTIEQSFWIGSKEDGVSFDPTSKTIIAQPKVLAYSIKFDREGYGIPLCNIGNPNDFQDYENFAWCDPYSKHSLKNHFVRIPFLGSDWIISEVSPPSSSLPSAIASITGGKVILSKPRYYGYLNVGEIVQINDLKLKLIDLIQTNRSSYNPKFCFSVGRNSLIVGYICIPAGENYTFFSPGGEEPINIVLSQVAVLPSSQISVVSDGSSLENFELNFNEEKNINGFRVKFSSVVFINNEPYAVFDVFVPDSDVVGAIVISKGQEQSFVDIRTKRKLTLSLNDLVLPSVIISLTSNSFSLDNLVLTLGQQYSEAGVSVLFQGVFSNPYTFTKYSFFSILDKNDKELAQLYLKEGDIYTFIYSLEPKNSFIIAQRNIVFNPSSKENSFSEVFIYPEQLLLENGKNILYFSDGNLKQLPYKANLIWKNLYYSGRASSTVPDSLREIVIYKEIDKKYLPANVIDFSPIDRTVFRINYTGLDLSSEDYIPIAIESLALSSYPISLDGKDCKESSNVVNYSARLIRFSSPSQNFGYLTDNFENSFSSFLFDPIGCKALDNCPENVVERFNGTQDWKNMFTNHFANSRPAILYKPSGYDCYLVKDIQKGQNISALLAPGTNTINILDPASSSSFGLLFFSVSADNVFSGLNMPSININNYLGGIAIAVQEDAGNFDTFTSYPVTTAILLFATPMADSFSFVQQPQKAQIFYSSIKKKATLESLASQLNPSNSYDSYFPPFYTERGSYIDKINSSVYNFYIAKKVGRATFNFSFFDPDCAEQVFPPKENEEEINQNVSDNIPSEDSNLPKNNDSNSTLSWESFSNNFFSGGGELSSICKTYSNWLLNSTVEYFENNKKCRNSTYLSFCVLSNGSIDYSKWKKNITSECFEKEQKQEQCNYIFLNSISYVDNSTTLCRNCTKNIFALKCDGVIKYNSTKEELICSDFYVCTKAVEEKKTDLLNYIILVTLALSLLTLAFFYFNNIYKHSK
ncbi:MAG: hypothetical protein N3D10_01070 [Candidatus Micrarchaeota archaeon]|nr:hypothetical protein [Candidatus Micrarchaeota archaeon]